jgi:hypothetical protein
VQKGVVDDSEEEGDLFDTANATRVMRPRGRLLRLNDRAL